MTLEEAVNICYPLGTKMPKQQYEDIEEILWERANEMVQEWVSECSPIDGPSPSGIQNMIEKKYRELLEEYEELSFGNLTQNQSL